MSARDEQHFMHLNREGTWPDFRLDLLESDGQAGLTLARLPRLAGSESRNDLTHLPVPDGPAGICVTPDGTLIWTDPQQRRVWARKSCGGRDAPLPCIDGQVEGPGRLVEPRGLALLPRRGVFLIADAGRHQILLVSLETFEVVETWGGPGVAPGRFDEPWSLAVDATGHVFVVDHGNARVQKLDSFGNVVTSFVGPAPGSWQPVDIAAAPGDRIAVLDRASGRVRVFDGVGSEGAPIPLADPNGALGLAARASGVFVGVNARSDLTRFAWSGDPVGVAPGYAGPVAALAIDTEHLWLHPGSGAAPLEFAIDGAYVRRGSMVGGPFGTGARIEEGGVMVLRDLTWHRLQTFGDVSPAGTHLQLFAAPTSDPQLPAPAFPDPVWRALASEGGDVLVQLASPYLWVAAVLANDDGSASPRIEQMRSSYDHLGYGRHLPAVYFRKGAGSGAESATQVDLLERFLALFESHFCDSQELIESVDHVFDSRACPNEWLDWLAGALGVQLDEDWADETRRSVLEHSFAASAWRGTARGLSEALLSIGIRSWIEEPIRNANWWALVEEDEASAPRRAASVLGVSTMLPTAEAQGAVLGATLPLDEDGVSVASTARLDASHLLEDDDFGKPLFQELAGRFSVFVYEAQVARDAARDEVLEVIEREKPAHTDYRLCVIEPRLRLGYQSRVGIDTLLGAARAYPTRLGESHETILGGRRPGRLGEVSSVGRTTVLGHSRIGVTRNANQGADSRTPEHEAC